MITILGPVLTALGHNQQRKLADDCWRTETRAWAAPAAQARYQQPSRIPLNLEHDPKLEVGEVVGLHRRHGDLLAICEAQDVDALLDADQPIYYSAEVTMNKNCSDIVIEGVALCTRPAAVALRPVQMYRGTVSEAIFRTSFPRDDFHSKEILEQALEQRYTRHGGPITISHPPPVVDRGHGEYVGRREVFYRPGQIVSVR
jgi:hypothetical protein